jgi:hypothetical protein
VVAGEKLQGDQRRATARRALVVEAAVEELGLLTEAELTDGPVGDRPHPVVGVACIRLDVVLPLPAQVGQLALLALLCEGVCLSGCLLERQDAESPFRERGAGPM